MIFCTFKASLTYCRIYYTLGVINILCSCIYRIMNMQMDNLKQELSEIRVSNAKASSQVQKLPLYD